MEEVFNEFMDRTIVCRGADLQPFLAVEPAQLRVVHDNAFACKQEVQSPIAEPPANGSQFA
jgi:hypothetical protein